MRGTIRRHLLSGRGHRRSFPKYESELADRSRIEPKGSAKVSINPRKVYGLAELIDIAQRNNPETHVAWERAWQAAAAVGLSESAYYPYLVASAAAGCERVFIPFPTLAVNPKQLKFDIDCIGCFF